MRGLLKLLRQSAARAFDFELRQTEPSHPTELLVGDARLVLACSARTAVPGLSVACEACLPYGTVRWLPGDGHAPVPLPRTLAAPEGKGLGFVTAPRAAVLRTARSTRFISSAPSGMCARPEVVHFIYRTSILWHNQPCTKRSVKNAPG